MDTASKAGSQWMEHKWKESIKMCLDFGCFSHVANYHTGQYIGMLKHILNHTIKQWYPYCTPYIGSPSVYSPYLILHDISRNYSRIKFSYITIQNVMVDVLQA